MQAIVLAGGRGTRLAGVVPDLPKPMAPIAGQPFLSYLLRTLELAGFGRVVLATGYRAEAIEGYFGSSFGAMELRYSREREPLGTGGAAQAALAETDAPEVFLLNGDTFTEVDYRGMLLAHRERGARLSLALSAVPDTARYGAVDVTEAEVTGFREKGLSGPGYINAGVYLLRAELFADFALLEAFSFEQDILAAHLARLRPTAFFAGGYFIDIGVPEDYLRAQRELPERFGMGEKQIPAE